MIIHHTTRHRFTTIDNQTIEDPALSWEAVGLLIYLLSKPDTWQVYTAQLVKARGSGRHVVLRVLRELEAAGYIVRERGHKDNGTFDSPSIVVYERPQFNNRTAVEEPQVSTGVQSSVGGLSVVGESTTSKDGLKQVLTEANTHSLAPAVAAACGIDLASLTRGGSRKFNAAVKELGDIGVTADQIPEAVNIYRRIWPDATVTPFAIANNWATLVGSSANQEKAAATVPYTESYYGKRDRAQRPEHYIDHHGNRQVAF